MKRFTLILLVFMMFFSLTLMGDGVKRGTLSNPTMLLNDTGILTTYPAAIQQFPNSIWIKVDNTPNNYFGFAYKFNDLAAISTFYAFTADNTTVTVPAPYNTIFSVAPATFSIPNNQHIFLLYGLKLSNIYGGLLVQNSFVDGTSISSKTIDTNEKEVKGEIFSGFKTEIKPSVILSVWKLTIYGTAKVKLNMNSYEKFTSYKSNDLEITPNILENIGADVTTTFDLSKKMLVGATVNFSMSNRGYKVSPTTNTKSLSETNYISKSISIGLTLGTKIDATKDLTLFFDIPMGIKFVTAGHWEGVAYNSQRVYSIPTLKAGADLNLGKGFNFRASAYPQWTRTVTEPSKNGTETIDSTYTFATLFTKLGLGYHTGNFYINAEIAANTFNNEAQKPLYVLDGLFSGTPGGNKFFTQIQINYLFNTK